MGPIKKPQVNLNNLEEDIYSQYVIAGHKFYKSFYYLFQNPVFYIKNPYWNFWATYMSCVKIVCCRDDSKFLKPWKRLD